MAVDSEYRDGEHRDSDHRDRGISGWLPDWMVTRLNPESGRRNPAPGFTFQRHKRHHE